MDRLLVHVTVVGRATQLNTAHTVGCAVELASALTAATILADGAVTSTVSEMTYNVSSGTLINYTQPTNHWIFVKLGIERWNGCGGGRGAAALKCPPLCRYIVFEAKVSRRI